ncbi:hypothetical protein [Algoriphagus confluentis]|uniref:hypothetical protein n=1 Tax=Algoriphagus confluentis TaxID=1697556 RepID=UPI0030C73C8D
MFAQENPNSSRWEVGLDVLSLFEKNSLPSYSLFGRYFLNPSGEKPMFLRSKLGYQASNAMTNTNMEFYSYEEIQLQNWLATIGFQRDFYTSPITSFYYGADIVLQRLNERQFLIFGDEILEQEGMQAVYDNRRISTSVFGFIGFSRKFGETIVLSFETALYFTQMSSDYDYNLIFVDGFNASVAQNSSKKYFAGAKPFSQLVLTLILP